MNLIFQAFDNTPFDRVKLSLAGSIDNLNGTGLQGGDQWCMIIHHLERSLGPRKAHQGDFAREGF